MHLKLVLEYDGGRYAGWQFQPGQPTVEGELRRALGELPLELGTLVAAGRTDAGTHAEGQVVSLSVEGGIPAERLTGALNAHLPPDVAVLECSEAPESFHARYSARSRRYRYRYLDRPARPALWRGRCWHLPAGLDAAAMDGAAARLVGRHDWTTYCTAQPERDVVRALISARVERRPPFVELEVVGEGFLRGMVRGIAAALAEVGQGRRQAGWPLEILEARDRALAAQTAPAAGLTLVEVTYG
ncbi:MAG TPA: tRNA pseudouridine(38-40) synthase TruA [Candidatus Dormibacteraeota bacterium]|nr:tRNA pseudouridine(38-40) synthase TruA [Candidatus Dormibacteraeota bacterium]